MGLYSFSEEDALRFARERGIRTQRRGKELWLTECPYCGKSGKHKFSIDLETGRFHCFRGSCNANGNMLTLARDFGFSLGKDADAYYQPKRHYKVFRLKSEEQLQPKGKEIDYLATRGISEATCRKYCITWSEKYECIVFPFRDEKGDICTIKYRNPAPKEGQSKEFAERDCKPILFGMYQCNAENKTLVVTEGQIDSLSVAEAGIENAVSVPTGKNGFTWVPECWDWMAKWEKIIVFGDNEGGKITLYPEIKQKWKKRVWRVRDEDYRGCKDANEILLKYGAEQIRKCIENAIPEPLPQIVDIAEVEDIDPSEVPLLPTGIFEIDDCLRGGLPFGSVVLITGKSGDGKSTFASQILLNAINEGYKTLAYSGELPNYLFKAWLTMQAAGARYTHEVQRRWGGFRNKEYRTDAETSRKITEWLRGKCWIIDTAQTETEDEEQARLVDLAESAIYQHGVKVVLLDNLMTAMTYESFAGNLSKYEQQSEFVARLVNLARENEVIIILVAHKRKNSGTTETNDTISGSADIVNLASVVLSYERPKEEAPGGRVVHIRKEEEEDEAGGYDRVVKLTKNRLFGDLLENGVGLMYEPQSKRIYHSNGERLRRYGWQDVEEFQYFQLTEGEDDES